MRAPYKFLFLTLITCSLATGLYAQQPGTMEPPGQMSTLPLRFEHFNVNDGLSQSNVPSIFQDHLGFIGLGRSTESTASTGYRLRNSKPFPSILPRYPPTRTTRKIPSI